MEPAAKPGVSMRPYLATDAPLLAEIFRASVEESTGDEYDAAQQEAWASLAENEEALAIRLARSLTLVGLLHGEPVGFISLADGSRLDMLYVHPSAAGQGVGTLLADAIEKLASVRGISHLLADVSDNAHEFFTRRGFHARQRNSIPVAGQWLANTTMEKQLPAKEQSR